LMERILHHLGCKKKTVITGINYLLTGAGFHPSTVSPQNFPASILLAKLAVALGEQCLSLRRHLGFEGPRQSNVPLHLRLFLQCLPAFTASFSNYNPHQSEASRNNRKSTNIKIIQNTWFRK